MPIQAKSNMRVLSLNPEQSVAAYITCIANQGVTLVSAHRGGPRPSYPENALAALQHAIGHGPMLLEVDVRETADGELVLLHDTTLERTTTGKGNLSDYTLAELASVKLVDNDENTTHFTIPSLNEVLRWADERAIVQIDVKRGIDYTKVAQAVVDADAVDSVLIIAYNLDNILTTLAVDKQFSFSYFIEDEDDLIALDEAGISRQQIVAWTGVMDSTDKAIWPTLEALDIPFAVGAFWHLEERIMASNDTQPYIDLSHAGTDVIGSDYYWRAFDTLAREQDIAGAIGTCAGK